MNQAKISAIAYHLPERVLTNQELAHRFPDWPATARCGSFQRPRARAAVSRYVVVHGQRDDLQEYDDPTTMGRGRDTPGE